MEAGWFGGENVVFVVAGGCQTLAVTAGARLYTSGYGGHGQMGHGDEEFGQKYRGRSRNHAEFIGTDRSGYKEFCVMT